jgi:hypothetical protein
MRVRCACGEFLRRQPRREAGRECCGEGHGEDEPDRAQHGDHLFGDRLAV